MLPIMSSTFVVPGGTGPSGSGMSGVERRVGVFCPLELDPGAVCLRCGRLSFITGVSLGANRGYIGVIGLYVALER